MFLGSTNIGRLILDSIINEPTIKTASFKIDPAEACKVSQGLIKVSSLPYKEDIYKSTQDLMKVAAGYINSMVVELDVAQKRASDFEKAAEVRCLIDDMVGEGLIGEHDLQEKVAELSKKSSRELEIFKEAVKLASKNKSGKNVFFEEDSEKTASVDSKKGMFDDVISTEL